jgi:hypothetical protein
MLLSVIPPNFWGVDRNFSGKSEFVSNFELTMIGISSAIYVINLLMAIPGLRFNMLKNSITF